MTHEDSSTLLSLLQPARGQGFRYGIDSFLLARFARFRPGEKVCDLGAGVGILGFLALKKGGVDHVSAVEIQEGLADLARKNTERLKLTEKMTILRTSWTHVAQHLK